MCVLSVLVELAWFMLILRIIRASPFEHDPIPDRQDDDQDSFHFIAYIPHEGRLYEMDGLQESPICHGAIDGTDWLQKAQTVLNQRIEK